MTTTSIKKGQTITASATETAYTLGSEHGPLQTVFLTWISGTFQYTTSPMAPGAQPVLDGTYTTISAAGSVPIDVMDGEALRISGSGTLRIDY